jgi:hypothetical protein
MNEDVIDRLDEEAFQGGFHVFVAVKFENFDTMELFDGGYLRAQGSCRDGGYLDWIYWSGVGCPLCDKSVGSVGEDEAQVTMVAAA